MVIDDDEPVPPPFRALRVGRDEALDESDRVALQTEVGHQKEFGE